MTASELDRLRAALAAAEGRAAASAALAQVRAVVSTSEAMIAALKLEIAILKRDKYGRSAERTARLIDQLELQLEELVADAAEDTAGPNRPRRRRRRSRASRRKPVKKPFPEHLPRERGVVEGPAACSCCGSDRIVKMGEDITETLEVVPRQWKVIQTVREKFTCRDCEKISQPPAPFQPIPRGWAGPSLLAMIVFEKYGQHQPLNRQADRYAREGVDLSLSTLADQGGAVAELPKPLNALIEAHVFAAARLHGDGEPSRRHAFETDGEHGAAAGPRRHENRAALDLCARRPPLWRHRPASSRLPLLPRSRRGTPDRASEGMARHSSG